MAKGMRIPSSVIQNSNILPQVSIKRSTFNLSEGHKTTFDSGQLIPIHWDEIYPGDTFRLNIKGLCRLATPIAPIMDNLKIKYYSFFVPNRLLWKNWNRFQGERDNPDDSTDYQVPQITSGATTGAEPLSLYDYMGVPTSIPNLKFSALPFRAYNKIWNEWFRDQNLQDSLECSMEDTEQNLTDFTIMGKAKPPDYFTSCTVSPQLGEPVLLPLGDKASVLTTELVTKLNSTSAADTVKYGRTVYNGDSNLTFGTSNPGAQGDEDTNLYADLSDATSATINDIRKAFQIQRILEKDARAGTRYVETILEHFGVSSPDYRLQRPEYLGGGSDYININPVVQTSSTDATTPQGNLTGVGVGGTNGNGYKYSATEHGILMTVACVSADVTYQQGLPRKFSKLDRFDYMLPSFWHIGEQAVLNKEIFAQGTVQDEEVFGYQQRYRELREGTSRVSGLFRSNHPQSLDVWHLSQEFENLPQLNEEFITEDIPMERVIAVTDEPHILADFYLEITATRPLPTHAVPGMIDHF